MVRYNNVFLRFWSVRRRGPWVYYPEIRTEVLACLTITIDKAKRFICVVNMAIISIKYFIKTVTNYLKLAIDTLISSVKCKNHS